MSEKTKTEHKPRSKNEQKRTNIIGAAAELFCELGFTATSMEKVAKLAGVSKQTVYSHFGNKDELFVAAIRNRCQMMEHLSADQGDHNCPKETLFNFAYAFINLLMSKEGISMYRLCISEAQNNPHISRLFYSAGPELVIAKLSTFLDYYNQRNILDIPDIHRAAIQFISIIRGEAVLRREYNTEQQISQQEIIDYMKTTINLFLKGYGYQDK